MFFFAAPSTSCVIPINDIRGIGSLVYAKVGDDDDDDDSDDNDVDILAKTIN